MTPIEDAFDIINSSDYDTGLALLKIRIKVSACSFVVKLNPNNQNYLKLKYHNQVKNVINKLNKQF